MTISMQEDEYENVVKVLLHIYAHAKRRKAITWTNNDPVHRRHMASPGCNQTPSAAAAWQKQYQ